MKSPETEEELVCTECGIGFCLEPCFNRGDQSLVQQTGAGNRTVSRNATQPAWGPAMDKPKSPLGQESVQEPSAVKERESAKSTEARLPESPAASRPVPHASREVAAGPRSVAAAPEPVQSEQFPRATRGRGEPLKTAAAQPTRPADPAPVTTSSSRPTSPVSAANTAGSRRVSVREPAPGLVHSSDHQSAPVPLSAAAVPEPCPPAPAPSAQALQNEPVRASDPESDSPGYMTSRLAGIRKLLVSLGRKSLSQDTGSLPDSDFEPRFDRATVRPAHVAPVSPEAKATESKASPPARVTLQPEFLRPRQATELEKEKEPLRPTSPQPLRDKPETQDEIETLPSVRGQYRRKKYSPM